MSQVTLVYRAFLAGLSPFDAVGAMSSIPLPLDPITFLGCRLLPGPAGDSTTSLVTPGQPASVIRTLVLDTGPILPADAAVTQLNLVDKGASASGIESVSIGFPGQGYVQPPVIYFAGGRLLQPPVGGEVNMFDVSNNSPAQAYAYLRVVTTAGLPPVNIMSAGSRYSSSTFIRITGTLMPPDPSIVGGGVTRQMIPADSQPPNNPDAPNFPRLPILQPVIDSGGHLVSVNVLDPGHGLAQYPTVWVVDPSDPPGVGAQISLSLEIDEILVTRPGKGYVIGVPGGIGVNIVPYFDAMFPPPLPAGPLGPPPPPPGDQRAPFRNLFTRVLEQGLMSPVSADEPVLS